MYGKVEVVHANGRPKLISHLSPRVKLAVNLFDGNNELYVHVTSRGKSISVNLEEFCDLCSIKCNIEEKLHFLTEVRQ